MSLRPCSVAAHFATEPLQRVMRFYEKDEYVKPL